MMLIVMEYFYNLRTATILFLAILSANRSALLPAGVFVAESERSAMAFLAFMAFVLTRCIFLSSAMAMSIL